MHTLNIVDQLANVYIFSGHTLSMELKLQTKEQIFKAKVNPLIFIIFKLTKSFPSGF